MPANQSRLLEKFGRYNQIQQARAKSAGNIPTTVMSMTPDMSLGHCQGFSFLDGYMDYLGQKAYWYELQDVALNWDGEEASLSSEVCFKHATSPEMMRTTLEKAMLLAISYVVAGQLAYLQKLMRGDKSIIARSYGPVVELMDKIGVYQKLDHSLKIPFTLNRALFHAFCNSRDIQSIFASETNICMIKGKQHATRLSFKDNQWLHYDPNYVNGHPRRFDSHRVDSLLASLIQSNDQCVRFEFIALPHVRHVNINHEFNDPDGDKIFMDDEGFCEEDQSSLTNHPICVWIKSLHPPLACEMVNFTLVEKKSSLDALERMPDAWLFELFVKFATALKTNTCTNKEVINQLALALLARKLKNQALDCDSKMIQALLLCIDRETLPVKFAIAASLKSAGTLNFLIRKGELDKPFQVSVFDIKDLIVNREMANAVQAFLFGDVVKPYLLGLRPVNIAVILTALDKHDMVAQMLPALSEAARAEVKAFLNVLQPDKPQPMEIDPIEVPAPTPTPGVRKRPLYAPQMFPALGLDENADPEIVLSDKVKARIVRRG